MFPIFKIDSLQFFNWRTELMEIFVLKALFFLILLLLKHRKKNLTKAGGKGSIIDPWHLQIGWAVSLLGAKFWQGCSPNFGINLRRGSLSHCSFSSDSSAFETLMDQSFHAESSSHPQAMQSSQREGRGGGNIQGWVRDNTDTGRNGLSRDDKY